jgi:hypothetical protein
MRRKYFERILCFIFKHEYVYQYRRISRGKKYDQQFYIYKCLHCEKYNEVKQ